ncbi:hypothetical protein OKW41_000047 [Paraburkholderia sp. UCT70]
MPGKRCDRQNKRSSQLQKDRSGDAGYIGVDKREETKEKTVKWHVAARRGKINAMSEGPLKDLVIAAERTKAQIRARVEHPFHIVQNLFYHRKIRYRGLARNTAQLFSLFALANLVISRNLLRSVYGSNPSCGERCDQRGSFTSQIHRNERRFDSLSGNFDACSSACRTGRTLISIFLV